MTYDDKSNKEIIKMVKDYYNKFNKIKSTDFRLSNNLPTQHLIRKRFGSLLNLFKLCDIKINEKHKKMYFSKFKNISNQELLDILKNYEKNVGFPTQRKFANNSTTPSCSIYYKRFGSFTNAILLSGIKIPKDRERYFNREKLSDKELLSLLKYYTDEKLKNNLFLLTNEDINNIDKMPSYAVYNSRFGGSINAYKLLGIDYYEFNNNALEKDMIKKYKKIYKILGRTPHSRDIDRFSKQYEEYYSMSSYEFHFGGIYELQIYCNFKPVRFGLKITREEMLKDLYDLYKKLKRVPIQDDIEFCKNMVSIHKYIKEFGSYVEALKLAKIPNYNKNNRIYITKNGNKCNSSYEFKFATILEKYGIKFIQEQEYKDVIKDFNKKYKFDFSFVLNNTKYFVEIFGLMSFDWYKKKAEEKIKICKENNLNLICLYKEDFLSKNQNDIYIKLLDEANKINN
jgi:hypothetical protein